MPCKKIIIGLCGSGKTTKYMQLNEEVGRNAIEIELPPSFRNSGEEFKEKLFELYISDDRIDTIISHPFYLCQKFIEISREKDQKIEIEFLNIPLSERKKRLRNRAYNSGIKENIIFSDKFFKDEELYFEEFKKMISEKIEQNN